MREALTFPAVLEIISSGHHDKRLALSQNDCHEVGLNRLADPRVSVPADRGRAHGRGPSAQEFHPGRHRHEHGGPQAPLWRSGPLAAHVGQLTQCSGEID